MMEFGNNNTLDLIAREEFGQIVLEKRKKSWHKTTANKTHLEPLRTTEESQNDQKSNVIGTGSERFRLEESVSVSPSVGAQKRRPRMLVETIAMEEGSNDGPETESTDGEEEREEDERKEVECAPTKMALKFHREVVTDVQKFVTSPVPMRMGTLECSMTCYQLPGSGLFGTPTEVYELRITDKRVRYEGIGCFTNVPKTKSAGICPGGPQILDLCQNRLVVIGEKVTRGMLNRTTSYVFSMAKTDSFHQTRTKDESYLIGKLEANSVGTEFIGYDLSEKLHSHDYMVPLKKENIVVRYLCSTGNPRQILCGIPQTKRKKNDGNNNTEDENDVNLWKSDVAPVFEEDTRCRVVPVQNKESSLSDAQRDFDLKQCVCLHNRKPIWSDYLQTHILDFGGRVNEASVKNFQLDFSEEELENEFIDYDGDERFWPLQTLERHERPPIIQFGRYSSSDFPKNATVYNLDVRYPFSPLQAMQVALSSLDNKIVN